jgi:hypothetical protein
MSPNQHRPPDYDPAEDAELALSDLLNRVLDKGVVIAGDVLISVADVDLIRLEMRLLLTAVESEAKRALRAGGDADVPVLPSRTGE